MNDQPAPPIDHGAADFNAVYRGGEFLKDSQVTAVPWDIGEPQPAVIGFERAGRVRGEVLDVGCGLGDNAVHLAKLGYRVVAVDAASAAIEQARARHGADTVEFAVADATSLTGYENRFDTILDSALYHTLSEEHRHAYAAAIHRAAKPGALLNLLCFADVPGGMPAPLSVSAEQLRSGLTEAGWHVSLLDQTVYWGVASAVTGFLRKFNVRPHVDEKGRTHLPVWRVHAERE